MLPQSPIRSLAAVMLASLVMASSLFSGCGAGAPAEAGAPAARGSSLRRPGLEATRARAPAGYRIAPARRDGPAASVGPSAEARGGAEDVELRAANPAQRLGAAFTRAGLRLEPRGRGWERDFRFTLATSRYGCPGDLRPVGDARIEVDENRAVYRRAPEAAAGLVEWFINGPRGLEHGFTLPSPPPCAGGAPGDVEIELSIGGDLTPRLVTDRAGAIGAGGEVRLLDRSGQATLRITDLHVEDATGRSLPARFARGERLSLRIDAARAVYPLWVDPLIWAEQQVLRFGDATEFDYFGWAASIDGDSVVIGAHRAHDESGAAYVFTRRDGRWTQEAELSTGETFGYFGISVALSGDTALVGSLGGAAAAYVYVRTGGVWAEQARLPAPTLARGNIGVEVALSGDTAVVSGLERSGGGAAYVYVRSGGVWNEQAKLEASRPTPGDEFGSSVAISGDTLVVGAPFDGTRGPQAGAAYIFTRREGVWLEPQRLFDFERQNSRFGWSVAISGDTALVGAPYADEPLATAAGSVRVFSWSGASWTQTGRLRLADAAPFDQLGYRVAISGDTIAASAVGKLDLTDPRTIDPCVSDGRMMLFARENGAWTEQARFLSAHRGDCLGFAVAVSGNTAVAGAPEFDAESPSINDVGEAKVVALLSATGDACAAAEECGSGQCIDGVCCATACDGTCFACSARAKGEGEDGVCGPVQQGSDPHQACKPLGCDGVGACLTRCAQTSDCAPGLFCDVPAGACRRIAVDIGDRGGCSAAPAGPAGSWWPVAGLVGALLAARRGRAPATRPRRRATRLPLVGVTLTLGATACGEEGARVAAAGELADRRIGTGEAALETRKDALLLAGDGRTGDEFGSAVALDGAVAVVGAPGNDAAASDAGAAYVLTRTADRWAQQAQLVAGDAAAGDRFGDAVALSGKTVVIGAPDKDDGGVRAGAAFVFVRVGDGWQQQGRLVPGTPAAGGAFGRAVAVSGDIAAIAAPGFDDRGTDSGAVFVFERSGDQWLERARLVAGDGAPQDGFGDDVALSGETLIVGAHGDDDAGPDAGAVYVFARDGGSWSQAAKLTPDARASARWFGSSLSLAGDMLGVGALYSDLPEARAAGAAHVFRREGGTFEEAGVLRASELGANTLFGRAVEVSERTVVAAAVTTDATSATFGQVHVFGDPGVGWTEQAVLRSSADAPLYDRLSLALSGDTMLLGDRSANGGIERTGAVHVIAVGEAARCDGPLQSIGGRSPGEPVPSPTACLPYRCDAASGLCGTRCERTSACAPGNFCDRASGACARVPADVGDEGGCALTGPLSAQTGTWGIAWLCAGAAIATRRRATRLAQRGV